MFGWLLESVSMDWKSRDPVCRGSRKDHHPLPPDARLDLLTSFRGKRDLKADARGGGPFFSGRRHHRRIHRDGFGSSEFYGI